VAHAKIIDPERHNDEEPRPETRTGACLAMDLKGGGRYTKRAKEPVINGDAGCDLCQATQVI
jgi:hypothetical protein